MKKQRDIEGLARKFVKGKMTLRSLASVSNVSKSSLHNYFRHKLPKINRSLYLEVDELLNINRKEGPIRGGLAMARISELKRTNKLL